MINEKFRVNLDNRGRISLTKVLKDHDFKSFEIYWENDRIILEPLVYMPASEVGFKGIKR